jgi:hypothetical protein
MEASKEKKKKKARVESIFTFSFLYFKSKMKIFALSAVIATVLATVSEAALTR